MKVTRVWCLVGTEHLSLAYQPLFAVLFARFKDMAKHVPLSPMHSLWLWVNDTELSPSGCHGVCLSVPLAMASAHGVDMVVGSFEHHVGQGWSLLLVPRWWWCHGLSRCCCGVSLEYFTNKIPALPCLASSLCRAPAFARTSQLGFLCDLAVKLTSILLNQKEESGKEVLALVIKGFWTSQLDIFLHEWAGQMLSWHLIFNNQKRRFVCQWIPKSVYSLMPYFF